MSADVHDRLIDAAMAKDRAAELEAEIYAEVKERLIDAHNRAFWDMLRSYTPWLPPFDEAYPDGVV